MAFLDVFGLVLVITIACFYVIASNDLEWNSIQWSHISSSKLAVVTPFTMGVIRLLFSAVVWAVASYLYIDPNGLDLTILMRNGTTKPVHLQSSERFVMFTVWSWLLQGIYFSLAALYSFSHYIPLPFIENRLLMSAVWVLFEVSFPIAFMVSAVVTFVLIPAAVKQKVSVKHFYYPASLLMHNANVIFMSIELILNRISFVSTHFPFILLYGIVYIVFTWILYQYKGVYYYFFLDYERKGAIFWYIGLIIGISLFFLFGWFVSQLIEQHSQSIWPKLVSCVVLHTIHELILLVVVGCYTWGSEIEAVIYETHLFQHLNLKNTHYSQQYTHKQTFIELTAYQHITC